MDPGGYRKTRFRDGPWRWDVTDPQGCPGLLVHHEVIEHEDGTITVSPSIQAPPDGGSWHGTLVRGVWREG